MADTNRTIPALLGLWTLTGAAKRLFPQYMRDSIVSLAFVLPYRKTANYVLVLADAGAAIEMNLAGANTLTVPANSTVAFDIGTVIEIVQYGAGQVTITPAGGVTIRTPSTLTTRLQYSVVSIRKTATDEWIVAGDVT